MTLNHNCECSNEAVTGIAGNGGDWRRKSLALSLMFRTTLDGFYFANCVLAAALFENYINNLNNK